MTFNILKLELSKLLLSPVGWIVLALFAGYTGMELSSLLEQEWTSLKAGGGISSSSMTYNLFSAPFGAFANIQSALLIVMPLLTMGLISQEINSGSIKLLYSSPIKVRSLVLGKYFAILLFSALMFAIIVALLTIASSVIENRDTGLIVSGLIATFFLMACYSAIGLFVSSLTRYPVIAALITVVFLGVLDYLGGIITQVPIVSSVTYWLSLSRHVELTTTGLITSADVIYFAAFIALFLYLTTLSLAAKRLQKKDQRRIKIKGISALLLTLATGYVASIQPLTVWKDMTAASVHRYSSTTEDIIKQLNGELEVTVYSNAFKSSLTTERGVKALKSSFQRLARTAPNLEFDYQLYYRDVERFSFYFNHRPDLSKEEQVRILGEVRGIDPATIVPLASIYEQAQGIAQRMGVGDMRRYKSGEKISYLPSGFSDGYLNGSASEEEIAAALKLLTHDVVKVGVLEGHHEAGLNTHKESDWGALLTGVKFRYSLLNNGFDISSIELTNAPIPDEIEILVIADLKKALSVNELTVLKSYIDSGRNLLIAVEPERKHVMDPILNMLKVSASNQAILSSDSARPPNMVLSELTENSTSYLNARAKEPLILSAPVLISNNDNSPFSYVPVLKTDKTQSYIDSGEREFGGFDVLSLLNRQTNNRTQKIVISGDAELFNNRLVSETMMGPTASILLIEDLFAWLTDEKFPVRLFHEQNKDTSLTLNNDSLIWYKFIFMFAIPALFVLASTVIWLKNRRR